MVTYTVTALGQRVTYNPERTLRLLRAKYPVGCTFDDVSEQNLQLVMHLYRQLGHVVDRSQAGGILQCLLWGRHVPNVLLVAAGLIKKL